jgi:hypothetical protein
MRQLSVAEMKGYWKNHVFDGVPAEGTRTRLIWDRLQAHRGTFVDVADLFEPRTSPRNRNAERQRITITWGLDIVFKSSLWCLVGEWKGKDYIDYLAERYK